MLTDTEHRVGLPAIADLLG